MKLKRFLTIIALLILTMIMLTGCMDEEIETDAKVSMNFDSQTITLNSSRECYVYLEINVKDGEYADTYQKKFEVSKNETLTISIEDIVADFFSENAQISNATVIKITKLNLFLTVLCITLTVLPIVILISLIAYMFYSLLKLLLKTKKTPK